MKAKDGYQLIASGHRAIAEGYDVLADNTSPPDDNNPGPINPDPVVPDPDPSPSKVDWILHVNAPSDWDSNLVYANLVRESRQFQGNNYLLPEVGKDIPESVLSNDWLILNDSNARIRIANTADGSLFVDAKKSAGIDFHERHQAILMDCDEPEKVDIYHGTWGNAYFCPELLKSVKGFSGFRSLDWILTNNVTNSTWQGRRKPEQVDQGRRSDEGGCWEDWFSLAGANENKYHWINIPHRYDNNAIRKLAELAMEIPGQAIVEFGNECWNPAPPFNANQRHCFDVGGGNDAKGYGLESERVWKIFEQVYSRDFVRVCCWQAVADVSEYETVHRYAPSCDAFAIAAYVGSRRTGQTDWEGSTKFLADGIETALSRMPAAMEAPRDDVRKLTAFCKRAGLRPFVYEMGNHLTAPNNDLSKLISFLRNPSYQEHYENYLRMFEDEGIEVCGLLTHIQQPRRNVSFGQQHFLGDMSPQWKAIQKVVNGVVV